MRDLRRITAACGGDDTGESYQAGVVEGLSALAVPIVLRSGDVAGSTAINMTSARLRPKRLLDLVELLMDEVQPIEASIQPNFVPTS